MQKQFNWNDLIALNQNKYQYQPEEQQIQQYAQFLGLSFPDDNRFRYLVIEGLKAPLPPFWQACQSLDGEIVFRNKKTRMITIQNPLDQIYKSKIDNLKLLQTRNNFFSINEQSAINESSGMFKSKLQNSDLKASVNDYNKQQTNKIMNRQITEQSIYSQKSIQMQESSPKKSSVIKSNTFQARYKEQQVKHVLKLLQIKNNIMSIVPKQNEMITKIKDPLSLVNAHELSKLMDLSKLQKISKLKSSILQKKHKLQTLNTIKTSLIQAKKEIIKQGKMTHN